MINYHNQTGPTHTLCIFLFGSVWVWTLLFYFIQTALLLAPKSRVKEMGKSTATKQAVVVFGALAFGWLAIELAFKPFLDKFRAAIDKSDPTRDPDDVVPPADSDSDAGADAGSPQIAHQ